MKLLVTEECGRLARWLRLMGYDAALERTHPLSDLYRRAYREGRAVVTRNRRVGASCLFRVVHLSSQRLDAQLRQLMRELPLAVNDADTFTRCDVCNVTLAEVPKARVEALVPPYVFQTQTQFHQCPVCRRIYWAATHYARASRFLDRLRQEERHA